MARSAYIVRVEVEVQATSPADAIANIETRLFADVKRDDADTYHPRATLYKVLDTYRIKRR